MLGNWIIQTTTTTGTGNLTLAAATGYPVISTQFAVNEVLSYTILDDATGAPLERGIGFLDSGGALVRSKPMATMVAGTYSEVSAAAVSLAAGTKRVICTPGAQSTISSSPGIWGAGTKGYGDVGVAAAASTLVATADRAIAMPFKASVDSDIDALAFHVTAAAASSSAKVAIFSMGSDGLPGVLLAESASVSTATSGTKVGTFTRMRPPPVFFGCIVTDGTPTVRGYNAGYCLSDVMGFDANLVPYGFIHHVGATWLTFPTTWTPVGNFANVVRPVLVARCAS